MSWTDPHVVTISATPHSMPRVGDVGDTGSEYAKDDGTYKLTVSHDRNVKGGRSRSMVRLDALKITADPYKPAENVSVTSAIYLVVDRPPAGWTNAEMKAVADGFLAMLSASSGADITKLLAFEH